LKFNVHLYDSLEPSLKDLTNATQGVVISSLVELAGRPDSPGFNVHRGDAPTKCWSARVWLSLTGVGRPSEFVAL